jgi:uncharacterized SAM-binding protein YcdF (DUF218 family)
VAGDADVRTTRSCAPLTVGSLGAPATFGAAAATTSAVGGAPSLTGVSGRRSTPEPELSHRVGEPAPSARHLVVPTAEEVLHPVDDDRVALDPVCQAVTARAHHRAILPTVRPYCTVARHAHLRSPCREPDPTAHACTPGELPVETRRTDAGYRGRTAEVAEKPTGSRGDRMRRTAARRARFRVATVLLASLLVLVPVGALLAWWTAPRDDPLGSPDAIVVLGGAGEERARLGAQLHERHGVRLVLSSSAEAFGAELGYHCPPALCITTEPETTAGEARDVARLADRHGWQHVAVATSDFHTARARMLFRQCLGDRVAIVGAPASKPRGVEGRLKELAGMVAGSTFDRAC